MFGGREVDRVTMLEVRCRLSTRAGKSAEGARVDADGQRVELPRPGRRIRYDARRDEERWRREDRARSPASYTEYAHPLDVNFTLEPEYLKAAAETAARAEASAARSQALHAGGGQPDRRRHPRRLRQAAQAQRVLHVCGRDFVRYDLAHYLDAISRASIWTATSRPSCAARAHVPLGGRLAIR